MKKIKLLIVVSIICSCFCMTNIVCMAQDTTLKEISPKNKFRNKDRFITNIIFDFNLDSWLNTPDEIKMKFWSPGIDINLMHEFPLKDNFSVAVGLGISSHNIHYNGSIYITVDSLTSNTYSNLVPLGNNQDNVKNKLSTNYLDVPIEFRYRTKENANGDSFNIAIGGKVGYLINVHSKTVDNKQKTKTYFFPNVNSYRYGVSARVGYAWFHLTGYYALSTLFKKDKGVKVIPYSVGITIIPF